MPRALRVVAALLALGAWNGPAPARAVAPEGAADPAPAGAAAAAGEPDALEWVHRGNDARQAGRLDDALHFYRKAADLAPEQYEIRILTADTLRRMGRADEASAAYAEAVRVDPARPEGYTGGALILRAAYRFDEAVTAVETALERITGRERADLLISMGETRRHQGRTADAAALFAQALAIDPLRPAAFAGQARLAEDRGDLDAAIDLWGRCGALRPEDGAATLRGQELREVRAALKALDATLAASPGDADRKVLTGERARLLAVAGDERAAAAAWRAALRLDPRSLTARRGLALALVAQGEDRGAAAEFRKVLRAAPDDGLALYHLAAVARRAGDLAAEEAAWTTLVQRRPDDILGARALTLFVAAAGEAARGRALAAASGATVAAARRRALLLADAGDWDGAAAALVAALSADPTDPWTLDVTQEILARRPALLAAIGGRAQAAAAAAAPGDPLPLLFLARCAALAGRDADMANLVRRAAQTAPDAPLVQSALGEVLLGAAPDPAPGLAALRRAVDADPGRVAASVDLALALLRAGRAGEAEAVARHGLERHPAAAELLSLAGAARADQGDFEGAARRYAEALVADPADNFHLARGQYPVMLAGLGRGVEARRALAGDMPGLPEVAYHEAWAFARDINRDRRYNGQDWEAWRARGPARTATPAETHRAIAAMLASLGDPYTRLRDPEETAAVFLTRHGGPAGPDRLGRQRPHSRTVVTDDLPGNLGYIQITNLADPNAVAEVRRALLAMRQKEGIVIDLRGNPGGMARSADAVADMLIGPGKEAGVDVTPEGASPRITGGDGAITDRPVTVLVDGQTASAAERLARGLDAAGRATVVGEPTLGKGEFQSSRVLPGGFTVLVSAGEALGPDGQPIQGRGLQPRSDAPRQPAPRPEAPRPTQIAPDPPAPRPR